jgi:hypothetical protein
MIEGPLPLCDDSTAPDCACPFEHWHIGCVCLDIHVEEEGYTHAILDAGDWQEEREFPGAATLEIGRPLAIEWARGRVDL